MKTKFESEILDQTDLKILGHLQKNARKTLTRMSKETRIPISSIYDRLKRLEGINVIKRYTSLFDLKKIGIHCRVLLLIRVNKSEKNDLEAYLMGNPFVNSLVRANGKQNFVAECLFCDMKDLESFTESVRKRFKGIEFSVHHILEDLKRESFLVGEAISQNKSIE